MGDNMNHLAVMDDIKYINKIVDKEKVIESRFSKNKISPYEKIEPNDTVYLKVSGSNKILAKFEVEKVVFLKDFNLEIVKNKYNKLICAPDSYFLSKKDSKYATLIYIKNPCLIKPINIIKKNRLAFVSNFLIVEDVGK